MGFEQAIRIFSGFTVELHDDRFSSGEIRELSLGMADNAVILAVIHTDRNGAYRIISARQADRKEKRYYEEEIRKTFDA